MKKLLVALILLAGCAAAQIVNPGGNGGSGGGGASPAGPPVGCVQTYVDSTHFGCSNLVYTAADQSFSGTPSSTSQNVKFFRVVASGNPASANTGILSAGFFEMDSNNQLTVNQVVGLHAEADSLSTGDFTELGGLQAYSFNSGSGAVANQYGSYLFAEDSSAGTVTNLYGEWVAFFGADGGGNITNLAGMWLEPAQIGMGSTVTNLYGFHVGTPVNSGTVSTLNVAYHNDNMTGIAGIGKDFSWYSEGGTLHAETGSAATVGMEIERFAMQSADLLDFLDSDGTTKLTFFDKAGSEQILSDVATPFIIGKMTASAVAPGAGKADLRWLAGTLMGTCKLVSNAGTSATEITIVDNVGGGC